MMLAAAGAMVLSCTRMDRGGCSRSALQGIRVRASQGDLNGGRCIRVFVECVAALLGGVMSVYIDTPLE